jgi:hypothetical protein
MRGAHKKKGRLRCHKRPKSREETPKEGSDSGVGLGGRYRIPLAKTIAISGSIERKGSRTDTKVYGARRNQVGVFLFSELKFLRTNQDHRSRGEWRQGYDHARGDDHGRRLRSASSRRM